MRRRLPGGRAGALPRIASLGVLALWTAGLGRAASGYTDLRDIEPVRGDAAAGARAAAVCRACHGVGAAVAPTFPRLAGQRAEYLYHRLVSFKSSGNEYYAKSPMRSQVANLTDTQLRDLAAYYASQAPTAGAAGPATPAGMGETLYLQGDPARGVPPCQGCHGTDARGTPIATGRYAAYPALRGQNSMYLAARLTAFHDHLPQGTTNDFIMNEVAVALDHDSIQAIAAWLGSLTPAMSR
jgi:cytochrome c553